MVIVVVVVVVIENVAVAVAVAETDVNLLDGTVPALQERILLEETAPLLHAIVIKYITFLWCLFFVLDGF
jgi:hypothetical protein